MVTVLTLQLLIPFLLATPSLRVKHLVPQLPPTELAMICYVASTSIAETQLTTIPANHPACASLLFAISDRFLGVLPFIFSLLATASDGAFVLGLVFAIFANQKLGGSM